MSAAHQLTPRLHVEAAGGWGHVPKAHRVKRRGQRPQPCIIEGARETNKHTHTERYMIRTLYDDDY